MNMSSKSNQSRFLQTRYNNECLNNRKTSDYINTLTEIDRNSSERRLCQKMKLLKFENETLERIDQERKIYQSFQEKKQQEEDFVKTQKDLQRQKYHEEKIRQQVRETNQELKELERKLRSGYISKALALQRAEKEAVRLREKIDKKKTMEAMAQTQKLNEEYYVKLKEDEKTRKFELRKILVQQIQDKYHEKQMLYQEFLKEKSFIDEIVRRIYEEQLVEMQSKCNKQNKFKSDIEYLLKQKEINNQKQKLESEEENQRIKQYIEERDKVIDEQIQKKKQIIEQKLEIAEQMGTELHEEEKKARNREELLIELQRSEQNEIEELKLRYRLEKELRQRIELRFSLDRQKLDKEKHRIEQEKEDQRFRDEQMKMFAERDKLEQLSNEKRMRKRMEHRREIDQCLEIRRIQRADEIAAALKQQEIEISEEKRMEQIIEEERIKMLKEHAENLIGYLPSGIFRETDRQYLALP